MSDQMDRDATNGDAQQTPRAGPAATGITPIQTQRLEALSLLAPGVALEFGNVMTIVLGSIEQLRRQSLDERGREQLRHAETGARQAVRLVGQALSLARPEGGTDRLVDLNEAVRGLDKMLTLMAGENTKVVLELAQQPLLARLEIDQLDLALLDLLRNGRDAISGNGLIVIRTSAHWIDHLGDQPTVELSMTVTGAAPIMARREPGSGPEMGLVTTRRFASSCGGRMVIEASPGGGTTVRLVVPSAAN